MAVRALPRPLDWRIPLLALSGGLALYFATSPWLSGLDSDAYWQAAMRLREGQNLYNVTADPNDVLVYRYAPWFAWAWVPLSYLPRDLVQAAWGLAMFGCAGLALWPARRDVVLVAVVLPFLVLSAKGGNVQPAMIAGLVWFPGPVSIALAGSLKAFPLLFSIPLGMDRGWRAVSLTLALATLLIAPAFLYDLSGYSTTPQLIGAHVWTMALGLGLAAFRVNRWTVTGAAMLLLNPRSSLYELSYLLVRPSK